MTVENADNNIKYSFSIDYKKFLQLSAIRLEEWYHKIKEGGQKNLQSFATTGYRRTRPL